MQLLVAVLVLLNVLDLLTTSYALRSKIGNEENSIVLAAIHWVGTTWGGLLLVKLPGFVEAALAIFPLFFASLGVPNWLLAWIANTSTTTWLAQIAFYALVVANNLRIVWRHAAAKGKQ
jgi:hypothetical protein